MKRSILIIAVLAFTNLLSNAQEVFPSANAKWTSVVVTSISATDYTYRYSSYVLQGDTVIDGIKRAKVYHIPDINKTDSLLTGYFHTVDKVVYYRQDENDESHYDEASGHYPICGNYYMQDYPLYDFSLNKGDHMLFCSDWSITKYVLNTDSIDMGGIKRKRMMMGKGPNSTDGSYWIEEMGNEEGLFFHIENIPISMDRYRKFVCFSQNDQVLYLNPDYTECPYPGYNSIDETEASIVTVFPNPASEKVTVVSPEPIERIKLYNASGMALREHICNGERECLLGVDNKFPAGNYYLSVYLQNGKVETEKLTIK